MIHRATTICSRPLTPSVKAACLGLALLAVVSCGDEVEPAPERYPALAQAAPLKLAAVDLGVGVRSGEPLLFSINLPDRFKVASQDLGHVMLRVQSYDELAQQFGEYTFYKAPNNVTARGAGDFIQQAPLGNADRRAQDLTRELDEALMRAQASGFDKRSVVVDLWRTRRDWYVRWDGLLDEPINRVGKGNYGLGRKAMYDALVERAVTIARELKPQYMILGDEMELLLATDQGAPLSRGEFSSFLSFYQEAAAKIRQASPGTKVGAGIHWDRFTSRVALSYSARDSAAALTHADLDAAFSAVILPILAHSDILALKSYRPPGEDAAPAYQFLRRLPALYQINTPVVWYSIGSPIENNAGAVRQRNYVADFAAWNAGVNVEAVFWDRLLNIDGADTANQQISGRCESLVRDQSKGFNAPLSSCYDGLFDSLYQPRPALNGLLDARAKP